MSFSAAVREPDDLLLADVATLALTLHQPAIVIENEPVPEEKGIYCNVSQPSIHLCSAGAKPGTRPLPTLVRKTSLEI